MLSSIKYHLNFASSVFHCNVDLQCSLVFAWNKANAILSLFILYVAIRVTKDMTMTGKDIFNYSSIFLGWKNGPVPVYLKKAFCQGLGELWEQFGKLSVFVFVSWNIGIKIPFKTQVLKKTLW